MSNDQNNQNNKPNYLGSQGGGNQGGGRGRQSLGQAFLMSMVRQIARSIGTMLVRMLTGGRR